MKDYSDYLNGGKAVTKKDFQTPQWIVSDYITREWNTNDAKYWLQYNIGSNLLNKYNVVPIASYTMCKKIDDNLTDDLFTVAKENVYGYFNNNNELLSYCDSLLKNETQSTPNNFVNDLLQDESTTNFIQQIINF